MAGSSVLDPKRTQFLEEFQPSCHIWRLCAHHELRLDRLAVHWSRLPSAVPGETCAARIRRWRTLADSHTQTWLRRSTPGACGKGCRSLGRAGVITPRSRAVAGIPRWVDPHSRPRSGGARRPAGDDRGVIRRRRVARRARRPAPRSGGLEIPPGSRPPRRHPRQLRVCMAARGRGERSQWIVSGAAGRTACPTPPRGPAVHRQKPPARGCLGPRERHPRPPSNSPATRRRRR